MPAGYNRENRDKGNKGKKSTQNRMQTGIKKKREINGRQRKKTKRKYKWKRNTTWELKINKK